VCWDARGQHRREISQVEKGAAVKLALIFPGDGLQLRVIMPLNQEAEH